MGLPLNNMGLVYPGLSLRGREPGISPSEALAYFQRKIEEKLNEKKTPSYFTADNLLYLLRNYSSRPHQGFWYFARSRTREILQNSLKKAKYREIRQKYFQIHVGKTYLILILAIRPVLFTPNVQIYLETSSLQRVNNVPKLPGVFRWTLRKTGH